MTANEAKQLTLQSNTNLLSQKEINWTVLVEFIFNEIVKKAIDGYSSLTLDLKMELFNNIAGKDFEFIKNKLESKGYAVDYLMERHPYGKREITINW